MAGALTGLLGGGGGVIGGASVRLVLDSAQFNAGLSAAEGRLKGAAGTMTALGRGMSTVGSTLTRNVTVPIVAAGAVATKMALDFNKAFVQIQTLAVKGGHSISQMKTEVMGLAQATGQDPTGLANALYQVLSAGKAAASQAFPILTAAAKGAAIGMGSVTDISKVLTSTMNAYGPKTISAAQAMDVLTLATKDSAASADALSTSIGPVIGIAAQAGISFQEVAAAMATATNAGIDTARAATGLRFLIGSLSTVTPAAKTALDRYGISVQDLSRSLSKQGLIATLQTLAKTFDLTSQRGKEAFKALVGGQRGYVAAASLVGKTASQATAELNKQNHAVGTLNHSFTIWGQTITGKNAIALGKLKVAAIQLGQQLIPIFEKVVGAVSSLVNWFTKLPDGMQSAVVKGLAFAALAGPFLKLGGIIVGLIGKFAALVTAEDAAAVSGGAAATAGAAGTGAATTASAGKVFSAGMAALPVDAAAAATSVAALTVAGAAAVPVVGALGVKAFDAATGAQTMQQAVIKLRGELASGKIDALTFARSIAGLGQSAGAFNRFLSNQASQAKAAAVGVSNLTDGILTNTRAQQKWGNWIGHNTGITDHQAVSLAELTNAFYKAGGSLTKAQSAALQTALAEGKATQATNILKGAIDKLPASKQIQIKADTQQAMGAIGAVVTRLNSVQNKTVTLSVVTRYSSYKTSPGAGGGKIAAGGIIRGQSGFVTQAPTYLVGEGGYSTSFGRGAEAVIPLTDNTLARLAKQMQKAGGAGRGITVNINTQGSMNPQELAASVSRHLSRTIREEALV